MSVRVKYKTRGDIIVLEANTGDTIELSLSENREFWVVHNDFTEETCKRIRKHPEYKTGTLVVDKKTSTAWGCDLGDWYFDHYRGVKSYFFKELKQEFAEFLRELYK